jgi:hypothetical protein
VIFNSEGALFWIKAPIKQTNSSYNKEILNSHEWKTTNSFHFNYLKKTHTAYRKNILGTGYAHYFSLQYLIEIFFTLINI